MAEDFKTMNGETNGTTTTDFEIKLISDVNNETAAPEDGADENQNPEPPAQTTSQSENENNIKQTDEPIDAEQTEKNEIAESPTPIPNTPDGLKTVKSQSNGSSDDEEEPEEHIAIETTNVESPLPHSEQQSNSQIPKMDALQPSSSINFKPHAMQPSTSISLSIPHILPPHVADPSFSTVLSPGFGLGIERMNSAPRFVSPYKSEQEMFDSEKIDLLIKTKLPDTVAAILGDPTSSTYQFPKAKPGSEQMERDLRKIKLSLLDRDYLQRKYAKLCILKYYDLLNSIYRRYCKIGRDPQWLTLFGWVSVFRDCGMIKTQSDEQPFIDIFHKIYQYHHELFHITAATPMYGANNLRDKDPWTGTWLLQKHKKHMVAQQSLLDLDATMANAILNDDGSGKPGDEVVDGMDGKDTESPGSNHKTHYSVLSMASMNSDVAEMEYYKFRKVGDRKLIGCIKDARRLIVAGWLNRSDFKKAKLQCNIGKRIVKDKRSYQCQLIPPSTNVSPLGMKIKWEHTKKGAASSKSGTVRLFKINTLAEDDVDLPIASYVGLSRHEFFDALLSVARRSESPESAFEFTSGSGKQTEDKKDLFILLDELIHHHLDQYLFKNMEDLRRFLKGKEIESECHDRLHSDSSVVRLFSKYASLQKECENMEEDAWCAMAEDLYSTAKQMDPDAWKNGGKPTEDQLLQCFTMSKAAQKMDEQWIDLGEFIRCLLHFTAALYRAQPDAAYEVMSFEDKLDLVLKWCHKIDAQTGRASRAGSRTSPRMFRSTSLAAVKSRKSLKVRTSLSPGRTPSPRGDDYDGAFFGHSPANSVMSVTSVTSVGSR